MPDQPLNPLGSDFTIRKAVFPEEADLVRRLFRDYQKNINVDLCFQSFEEELAALPGKYSTVLLAFRQDEPIGSVALRTYTEGIGEMKRLFLYPEHRGGGRGRQLALALLDAAREAGFTKVHLDTIRGKMDPAIALYRDLGFVEVPSPARSNSPDLLDMEVTLGI